MGALKQKYKKLKDKKSKQSLAQLVSEKLMIKYKCKTHCKHLIGCYSRTIRKTNQAKKTYIQNETKKSVRLFFLGDDVSRLTTGKRNTLTLRKVKKQRRLLIDSLLNLHRKYISEDQQILYSAVRDHFGWFHQMRETERRANVRPTKTCSSWLTSYTDLGFQTPET